MAHPRARTLAGVLTALTLTTATACSGSALSSGDKDSGAPLKIGVIVPLTGSVGPSGQALRNGLKLGFKKVNAAGGVNGRPVEYVVADDAGNPATSTQLARRMVQEDKVSMVFGTITGDTAEAVAEVTDGAKVPFGTAILGDTEKCFPYQWGFGETSRQLLTPSVPELVEKYGKRVAIVGSDYNYPHFYAKIAKQQIEKAGARTVAEEYSPLGQADWQPVVKRLKAAKPDLLLSMAVGGDAVSFSKQAQEFGLLTPELGFEGSPLDTDYYPALSKLVNGRTHTVRWSDALKDPESESFVAAYRSAYKFKAPIPEVAGSAYFGIQFLLAAADKAGSTDGEKINAEIGKLRYDSPLGKDTSFAKENHLLQADMLQTTIKPGGAYEVTRKLGRVADTTPKPGCA
ncbi:ABC transporter substrate-binding protein [Streptomyces sp. NPDC050145]|uniref:ABC transporter substrate-binding protein n=1 Tax=Streptomyces sp. NPDC050145 TaxID=3365602 RepID=UPI0037BA7C1F